MNVVSGLPRLDAQVARDLAMISWPPDPWVKPALGPDGKPMLNVLVVGAGQGGLTVAFQLTRERVDRVLVVDRAPPDRRGPWKTYGRMKTLRSPKIVTGPDLDVPSLTFQNWFEALHGPSAWRAMDKIPKEMWADYLAWFERVLGLPVETGVTATRIDPQAGHVAVDLAGPGGTRTVFARQVVLATGIESPGRWWMPDFVTALPEVVRNHACDDIDFTRLAGKVVAVLGAGASAFDNAATALEAGAESVHVFFRRAELQRVQPFKQISYVGLLRHMVDLPDEMRWRFMRHLLTLREAFPAETHDRVVSHSNAHLHPGSGWTGASMTPEGRVRIDTAKGPFEADHVICGTGFDIDLRAVPELTGLADSVATWADRHPALAQPTPRLAGFPYLGDTFEFLPKGDAEASAVSRIRLFTFGSTVSFGPSGSSINALKFGPARLVSGITRTFFTEDAEAHLADLLAYDTPEF